MSESSPRPRNRPRIFYGWYIVGLTALGGLFSGTTSQAFFGVFIRSIEADTGWSRTAIAGAISAATLVGGGVSFGIGVLVDKYGPRVLMTLGAVLYVAGYSSMFVASELWHLYGAYIAARLAALQTMSGVVPRTALVNWFRRMRGRVLGIQATTQSLGGGIMAAIAGTLLAIGVDWRTVFLMMATAAGLFLVVPVTLFMRRQPEDLGLVPDGDVGAPEGGDDMAPEATRGLRRLREADDAWTLRQAVRSRTLWLIAIGHLLSAMASGGISFSLAAYLGDIGLGAGYATAAASLFLLSGAFAATAWGFLSERVDERMLVVIATAIAALLSVYGQFIFEPIGGLAFAIGYGATTRGEGALVMILLASYYGRRSFGSISGLVGTFALLGLGSGPIIFTRVLAVSGGYDQVFWLAAIILGISTVMLWFARRPTPTLAAQDPRVEIPASEGE